MTFDFEAFYKAVIMVCCVAVSITAVVSLWCILKMRKNESEYTVSGELELTTEDRDDHHYNRVIEMQRLKNAEELSKRNAESIKTLVYHVTKTIKEINKRIDILEQKLNEIYIEE